MTGCTSMIKKRWEITCDYCDWADHYAGTKQQAIKSFEEVGHWLINKDGTFCNNECYQNWLKQHKSMYE